MKFTKKNVVILIAVIIVLILGIKSINFSSTKPGSNPDIIINPQSKQEKNEKRITFTIDMRIINENNLITKLKPEYKEFIPKDGFLANKVTIGIKNEYSLRQVLETYAKDSDIKLEFKNAFNLDYLSSINNIGEKSTSKMSGWLYLVNNKMPSTSIDQTKLNDKDDVIFIFSNDGGNDIKKLVNFEYEAIK